MNGNLEITSEISERRMSPAVELRTYLAMELHAEAGSQAKKAAVAAVARRYGISPRRVLAVVHGEVGRVWADEMDRARVVYRRFVDRQQRRLQDRLAELAAERTRLDAQDAQDGVT